MENILRKRVRATIKNRATKTNEVVYGYYTIDINGYINVTVFANTKSYSYKSGVCTHGKITAKVVGTQKYRDNKHIVRIMVVVNRGLTEYVTSNSIFADALLAVGYTFNVD